MYNLNEMDIIYVFWNMDRFMVLFSYVLQLSGSVPVDYC